MTSPASSTESPRFWLTFGLIILGVYLSGYGLIRINCDEGGMIPSCLQHSANDWENPFGRLVVTAYTPLFRLDAKLTGRVYLRRMAWFMDSI